MKYLLAFIVLFASSQLFSQSVEGTWSGDIQLSKDNKLPFVIHIEQSGDSLKSTAYSPAQGSGGQQVNHTSFMKSNLIFEIHAVKVQYMGTLRGDSISGVFSQYGQEFPLTLRKGITDFRVATIQYLPNEKPITLETSTGRIDGTLTLPETPGKVPVTLLIAGSGPTDRDGNQSLQLQTNATLQLAQALAKSGIASVRYDKRGVGKSAASLKSPVDLRLEHYIEDAKAWLDSLKKDNRFSKIIVAGHSEGSLIGMVAAKGTTDKFISIAGAGFPADEILKTQLKTRLPESLYAVAVKDIDSLKNKLLLKQPPKELELFFHATLQPYLISWFQYDPRIEIRKLSIPVLIIQGTKDIQISEEDAQELKKALPKSKIVLIPNMNHIYKDITGGMDENSKSYSNPNLPINTTLVKTIVDFIKK